MRPTTSLITHNQTDGYDLQFGMACGARNPGNGKAGLAPFVRTRSLSTLCV